MWLLGGSGEGSWQTLTSIRDELRLNYPEVSTSTPNLIGEDRYNELYRRLKQARESRASKWKGLKTQPAPLHFPETACFPLPITKQEHDGHNSFQNVFNLALPITTKEHNRNSSHLSGADFNEKNVTDTQSKDPDVKNGGIFELIGNLHNKDQETSDSRRWYSEYRSSVLKNVKNKQGDQISKQSTKVREDPLIATVTQHFNLFKTSRNSSLSYHDGNAKAIVKNQNPILISIEGDPKNVNEKNNTGVDESLQISLGKNVAFSQPIYTEGSNVISSTDFIPIDATSNPLSQWKSVNFNHASTKTVNERVALQRKRDDLGKKAILLLQGNNLVEANACFEQSIRDDPTNQRTLCNYAIFVMKYMKQPETVKPLFRRFIESSGTETLSLTEKVHGLLTFARFFHEIGWIQDAKEAYGATLKLDPKNHYAVRRYAKLLMGTDDGVRQVTFLDVKDKNTALLCACGKLLSANGHHKQARLLYLQCNESDRTKDWLRNYALLLRNART
jgi:tetratricopeptide (TPR) repeat protein